MHFFARSYNEQDFLNAFSFDRNAQNLRKENDGKWSISAIGIIKFVEQSVIFGL